MGNELLGDSVETSWWISLQQISFRQTVSHRVRPQIARFIFNGIGVCYPGIATSASLRVDLTPSSGTTLSSSRTRVFRRTK